MNTQTEYPMSRQWTYSVKDQWRRCIYVAGPYSASCEAEVWDNIMHARERAHFCWQRGWVAICPHTNSMLMSGGELYDCFVEGYLTLLSRLIPDWDAIYLLRGWRDSPGANREWRKAADRGLLVYVEGVAEPPDLLHEAQPSVYVDSSNVTFDSQNGVEL